MEGRQKPNCITKVQNKGNREKNLIWEEKRPNLSHNNKDLISSKEKLGAMMLQQVGKNMPCTR